MSNIKSDNFELSTNNTTHLRKRSEHFISNIDQCCCCVFQKADFAAAPLVIDKKYEDHLTYSKPFLHATYAIVMQRPPFGQPSALYLEDLMNQTYYRYGVVAGSHVAKQLRKSKIPRYEELWQSISERRGGSEVRSVNAGLDRARRERFALILESVEALYLTSRPPCGLIALSQFLTVTNYAFAVKKENPLVQELDRALLQLQERGVLQNLFHKWWSVGECDNEPGDTLPWPQGYDGPNAGFNLEQDNIWSFNETDLQANYSSEMDLERIILTSPAEEFTPGAGRRKPRPVAVPVTTTTQSYPTTTSATTTITSPSTTSTTSTPTTTPTRERTTKHHVPNFDDFEWFFATERARPDSYDDYDFEELPHQTPFIMGGDVATPTSTVTARSTVTSTTRPTTPTTAKRETSSTSAETSSSVSPRGNRPNNSTLTVSPPITGVQVDDVSVGIEQNRPTQTQFPTTDSADSGSAHIVSDMYYISITFIVRWLVRTFSELLT